MFQHGGNEPSGRGVLFGRNGLFPCCAASRKYGLGLAILDSVQSQADILYPSGATFSMVYCVSIFADWHEYLFGSATCSGSNQRRLLYEQQLLSHWVWAGLPLRAGLICVLCARRFVWHQKLHPNMLSNNYVRLRKDAFSMLPMPCVAPETTTQHATKK